MCEFQTDKDRVMTNHTNSIHLNQKRFMCTKCDFKSYHRINLKSHMIKKHGDTEGEIERIDDLEVLECKECKFKTKNLHYLSRHMKLHLAHASI